MTDAKNHWPISLGARAMCFHAFMIAVLMLWGDPAVDRGVRSLAGWANEGRTIRELELSGAGQDIRVTAVSNGLTVADYSIRLESGMKVDVAARRESHPSFRRMAARRLLAGDFWDFFKQMGSVYAGLVVAGVVVCLDSRQRRRIPLLAAAVVAGIVIIWFLQHMTGRLRPDQVAAGVQFLPFPAGWHRDASLSFPSSHAAFAFSLAGFLTLLYPRAAGLFVTVAVLTGISRVLHGKHWVSDVYAGGWLGWWMVFVVSRLTARLGPRPVVPEPDGGEPGVPSPTGSGS